MPITLAGACARPLHEVVKSFEVEPIALTDGESLRLRLDICREFGTGNFRGKVYRLERYRGQPTFPQTAGEVLAWQGDSSMYVVDESYAGRLTGTSVRSVVELFHAALDETCAAHREGQAAPTASPVA